MRRNSAGVLAFLGVLWCSGLASAQIDPNPTLPDAIGVNVHFIDPEPGEMKLLAATGMRWVRTDLTWQVVEQTRGHYDFAPYDRLVSALESHGMRAWLVLDYGNKLYDNGLAPYTDGGRAAFARFAVAAARRFAGRGILWELYNEPNAPGFWQPKPNVDDYIKLAFTVGEALHEAMPHEIFIGPAMGAIDLPFLEACFKAGLLNYWSAVTFHPYRQLDPETVAPVYRQLQALIAKYAAPGRNIPLLAGEWGYPKQWSFVTSEKQGEYLARSVLISLANQVPIVIWYEWRSDDMGIVTKDLRPTPAYRAAQTLASVLKGYRFTHRIPAASEGNYVFEFRRGASVRYAAWSTSSEVQKVSVPLRGRFRAVSLEGSALPPLNSRHAVLTLALGPAPQFLIPAEKGR